MKIFDQHKDFLIDCPNPEALDKILNRWDAALQQGPPNTYLKIDGHYIMRIYLNGYNNEGFIKFALENKGYAKIVKEL